MVDRINLNETSEGTSKSLEKITEEQKEALGKAILNEKLKNELLKNQPSEESLLQTPRELKTMLRDLETMKNRLPDGFFDQSLEHQIAYVKSMLEALPPEPQAKAEKPNNEISAIMGLTIEHQNE